MQEYIKRLLNFFKQWLPFLASLRDATVLRILRGSSHLIFTVTSEFGVTFIWPMSKVRLCGVK